MRGYMIEAALAIGIIYLVVRFGFGITAALVWDWVDSIIERRTYNRQMRNEFRAKAKLERERQAK